MNLDELFFSASCFLQTVTAEESDMKGFCYVHAVGIWLEELPDD